MSRLTFVIVIFMTPINLWAASFDEMVEEAMGKELAPFGVGVNLALGYPSVTIKQTDGRESIYSGAALWGQLLLPVAADHMTSFNGIFSFRYLDLQNNVNGSSNSEFSNQVAVGLGASATVYRMFLGFDYSYAVGRHYWVGENSDKLDYNYWLFNYYAGMNFNITDSLRFALSYSIGSGDLPKGQTQLEDNSPYSDGVIWLHFSYGTGQSTSDFMGKIFTSK